MGVVQSQVLQAWSTTGSQASDQGVYQPGLQVLAPRPLIGVHIYPGFRCVLGLLIWCSQSRGCGGGGAGGHGCCEEFSKQPLSVSIFFFLFEKFLLFQPWVRTSTWPLTQPSVALSQESCSRPCAPAGASAALVPALVPGTLVSLSTLLTI